MKKINGELSNEEYNVLSKDLKYNLHFEKKDWMKNVALEAENTLKFVYVKDQESATGSVLAFGTQVRGFKSGRSRRIFRVKKILSTPSFGGEVKPSVPCRRFTACKRSLNLRGNRNLGKITTGHLSRPQFHLSLLGSLASQTQDAEARGGESGNF